MNDLKTPAGEVLVTTNPPSDEDSLVVTAKETSNRLNFDARYNKDKKKLDYPGLSEKDFNTYTEEHFWEHVPGKISKWEKAWKQFLDDLEKANNPDEMFATGIKILCDFIKNTIVAYLEHRDEQIGKRDEKMKDKIDNHIRYMTEHHGGAAGVARKAQEYAQNAMYSDLLKEKGSWNQFNNYLISRYGEGEKYAALFKTDPETDQTYIDIDKLNPEEQAKLISTLGGRLKIAKLMPTAVNNYVAKNLFHFKLENELGGRYSVNSSTLGNAMQWIPLFRVKDKALGEKVKWMTKNMTLPEIENLPPIYEAYLKAEAEAQTEANPGFSRWIPTPSGPVKAQDPEFLDICKQLDNLTRAYNSGNDTQIRDAQRKITNAVKPLVEQRKQFFRRAHSVELHQTKLTAAETQLMKTIAKWDNALKRASRYAQQNPHQSFLKSVQDTLSRA